MQAPGRLEDAIAAFQAALQRQDDADTHALLADALAQTPGRQREAIAHYETVIQLRPDSRDADNARQAIARLRAAEGQRPRP